MGGMISQDIPPGPPELADSHLRVRASQLTKSRANNGGNYNHPEETTRIFGKEHPYLNTQTESPVLPAAFTLADNQPPRVTDP